MFPVVSPNSKFKEMAVQFLSLSHPPIQPWQWILSHGLLVGVAQHSLDVSSLSTARVAVGLCSIQSQLACDDDAGNQKQCGIVDGHWKFGMDIPFTSSTQSLLLFTDVSLFGWGAYLQELMAA